MVTRVLALTGPVEMLTRRAGGVWTQADLCGAARQRGGLKAKYIIGCTVAVMLLIFPPSLLGLLLF
jgi:hypothetical protein